MLKGSVTFDAAIRGNGLKFERFESVPAQQGVEKVEMEAPNGDNIHTTVHFAAVASRDEAKAIADKVTMAALNRIGFNHDIAIENARMMGHQFSQLAPKPGVIEVECGDYMLMGNSVRLTVGVSADTVRKELEQTCPPGEDKYGLLRSARQSMSPVEEFMHLYNILLMICGDNQAAVDTFVLSQQPAVPQTPDPRPNVRRMETVYTRLRNELAHKRSGVDLGTTKSEMAARVPGLVSLTKKAIELNP